MIKETALKTCVCKTCGNKFATMHKRSYCYNPCYADRRVSLVPDWCVVCGVLYDSLQVNRGAKRYSKCCSLSCRRTKVHSDDVQGKSQRDSKRQVRKAEQVNAYGVRCATCHQIFIGYTNKGVPRKFCSNECANKKHKLRAKRIACMCRYCGSLLIRTEYEAHNKETFCDSECYLEYRKSSKTLTAVRTAAKDGEFKCAWCDGPMVGQRDALRVWCSKACCQRAAKQRRKYYKLGNGKNETISIKKLYVMNDGICQLCGKTCTVSIGRNDLTEATIDHIIPVSQGGQHSWDNVQLACRKCNNAKSDTLPGRLF